MNEINELLDELILTINKKKIAKKTIYEELNFSRPYLNKLLEGEGRTRDFARLLDYCRNYEENKKAR